MSYLLNSASSYTYRDKVNESQHVKDNNLLKPTEMYMLQYLALFRFICR